MKTRDKIIGMSQKKCASLTMTIGHDTGNNGPLRLHYVHIRENSAHARENNAHLPKQ